MNEEVYMEANNGMNKEPYVDKNRVTDYRERQALSVDKEWFSLCGILEAPVKKLEELQRTLKVKGAELEANIRKKGILKNFIRNMWKGFRFASTIWAVIVAVAGIFIRVGDERLTMVILYKLEPVLNAIYHTESNTDSVELNGLILFLGVIILIILTITYIIVGFGLIVGIYSLPVIAIWSIIMAILTTIHATFMEKKLTKETAELKEHISAASNALSEPIAYIPPSYRNSISLAYFYDSFCNMRVKTIQEAVNQCDTYLFRLRQTQQIDNLLQSVCCISLQLEGLNDLMEKQQKLLKEIDSDIFWYNILL